MTAPIGPSGALNGPVDPGLTDPWRAEEPAGDPQTEFGAPTGLHDPFAALIAQADQHPDLRQLIGPQHNGAFFTGNVVVMAPGPFVQRSAMPDKIGGPNPPVLEPGKHSGPIVTDMQGKLNMWRERQWHDLQGRPGWLTSGLDLKGKFDRQTAQTLKEFQKSVGLPATGVADAATQNLLKIESDPHYWRATTQMQRAEVRKLIGSIDAVHADAVVKLLDSNAFRSPYTDQTRAIAALVASRGDPAFAASLERLLDHISFKHMAEDDKSALLRFLAGHADARTADALLSELKNTAAANPLMRQAFQEWSRFTAGLKPAEVFGRNSGQQPLTPNGPIPRADWARPEVIVGKLTQVSVDQSGPNAWVRCGPSSLLAGALLRGKDAAAQLLDKVADNRRGQLTDVERRVLHTIADKLRSGDATFPELSLAQDLLYRAASTRASVGDWRSQFTSSVPNLAPDKAARLDELLRNPRAPTPAQLREMSQLISTSMGRKVTAGVVDEPLLGGQGIMLNFEARTGAGRDGMFDGGLDDTELQRLATAGGMSGQPLAYRHSNGSGIEGVFGRLLPGESAIVHIALVDRVPNGPPAAPNHFISVGVMADGRPYIYNPAPQPGDATLVISRAGEPQDAAFSSEVQKYSKRAEGMGNQVRVNALKASP
ncbi:MAG TPA: peptidoglycan-binding domain-containing protein [Burkholderiaceae bacterium]|nr:peptidoglycan-binding domain-containing protein [Burkholderiaceae bacterium]